MSRRDELLQKCGLNKTSETSHCFNDTTHLTCCELGPEARKYSDNSGNPIGKLSERVAGKSEGLTPWCTCAGSEVCSYLKNKFNDGTNIKFFYNPKTNEVIERADEKAEFMKTHFPRHFTPGIVRSEGDSKFDFFKYKWFWVVAVILLVLFVISLIKNLIYIAVIVGIVILGYMIMKAVRK